MASIGVKLGSIVTDEITGFKGTAVAKTEYLNGCIRVEVQPEGLHKETGKPLASDWFDEQTLCAVSAAKAGGPGSVDTDPFETE